MQLPSRMGGLSLRSVEQMAHAAYVAGMCASFPAVLQNFIAVHPDREMMLTDGTLQQLPMVQAWIDAAAHINTELGPLMALTADGLHTDLVSNVQTVAAEPAEIHILDLAGIMAQGTLHGTQGMLTSLLDKQKLTNLKATYAQEQDPVLRAENQARIHSSEAPGSIMGSWQHVPMTSDTLYFDGPTVALTMQRTVGIESRWLGVLNVGLQLEAVHMRFSVMEDTMQVRAPNYTMGLSVS